MEEKEKFSSIALFNATYIGETRDYEGWAGRTFHLEHGDKYAIIIDDTVDRKGWQYIVSIVNTETTDIETRIGYSDNPRVEWEF